MPNYYVYDANGVILKTGQAPDNLIQQQAVDGQTVGLGVADDLTQYVLNGSLTPKMPIIPLLTGSTISNLPIPCTLHIDGSEYVCDDGSAELELAPGTYKVRLEAMHHLSETVEVVV